jgi:hypothetical protein
MHRDVMHYLRNIQLLGVVSPARNRTKVTTKEYTTYYDALLLYGLVRWKHATSQCLGQLTTTSSLGYMFVRV